jgi:hypothetical protein
MVISCLMKDTSFMAADENIHPVDPSCIQGISNNRYITSCIHISVADCPTGLVRTSSDKVAVCDCGRIFIVSRNGSLRVPTPHNLTGSRQFEHPCVVLNSRIDMICMIIVSEHAGNVLLLGQLGYPGVLQNMAQPKAITILRGSRPQRMP